MGNVCQPFGFSIDDGMKAFCIGEMFVGIFHLIMAYQAFSAAKPIAFPPAINGHKVKRDLEAMEIVIVRVLFLLVLTLIAHFVMGMLLYFLGFKKRNVTICFAWIVVACFSFTLLLILLLCGVIYCSDKSFCSETAYWSTTWLYLLYIFLGVWVVWVYMK